MTLNELLLASYTWADGNATLILAASLLLPAAGTALAWIGKGGRTDRDGRFVASAVVGIAFVLVLVEAAAIFAARSALGASLLEANALLLLAPVVCLVGSVLGVRAVFPLNELGSVRAALDAGAFLIACGGALWLLSKFRGWGVLFFGSFAQLLIVGAIGMFFLWRLYKRAFGRSLRSPPTAAALPASPGSPAWALVLSAGVVVAALGILALFARLQPATLNGQAATPAAVGSTSDGQPPRAAAGSPSPAEEGRRYFTYVDDEGVQQIVDSLAKVPARFRKNASALP